MFIILDFIIFNLIKLGLIFKKSNFIFVIFLGCLGFEPRTFRLKAEYSTIELATLNYDLFYSNYTRR